MAADEGQAEYDRQVRKLRELFHGRFSFEEARELMIANGGYREAAQFVLSGDPDEVTTFIFGLSEDLRELRETSAARVYHELTSGITTSTRLFACFNVSECEVRYDPVPRDKEWGLALFECDCGNSFKAQGIMNETTRQCYECFANLYPTEIIPPSDDLQLNPRRAPMRQRIVQRISRRVYYPSQVHESTGSTVTTCLTQGTLRETYNFPIVLRVIEEEHSDDNSDNN
ncbi:hypothetical protein C0Q70_15767 [Pomacea canaliculata]|uniref:Uncharacterized protein n=1 Tax=Pomacea canaliculata TaxID=400727 RepID=A0A2T7NVS1_POMCA|nr:hypothetical protein C0Q70_15767 [Pomacea canaliculata]